MTGLTDDQKRTVNELQTCMMKYPEQIQKKETLEDIRTAVTDMSQNLDKGYDEAAKVVDSINKKGF